MSDKSPKADKVSVRLDPDVARMLARAGKETARTRSTLFNEALREALTARGYARKKDLQGKP